jgi:A/G-specific adenine glycosylase
VTTRAKTRRIAAIRKALLAWYQANRRDLPWRRTRDPYSIWVSELMLQQTRVETVIPYYHRFLERFPSVNALAEAPLDDVLGQWAGLGYYSRARNLHEASKIVSKQHGGVVPSEAEELLALPGIGRYTAGAVASIAYERPEPVVDGNVIRVLTRLHGIEDDVALPATLRRLWDDAGELARGPEPGALNQSLMELGATLCTPRKPRCLACPIARRCVATKDLDPERLPVKTKKQKRRSLDAVAAFFVRRGKALAVQRPPRGLMGGMWELPGGDVERTESAEQALHRCLLERVGVRIDKATLLGVVEHTFTHIDLRLHVFHGSTPAGRVRLDGYEKHRWLAPSSLDCLPHGAATRRALALALDPPERR